MDQWFHDLLACDLLKVLAWRALPDTFADDLADAEALTEQGFERNCAGGDVAPMLGRVVQPALSL